MPPSVYFKIHATKSRQCEKFMQHDMKVDRRKFIKVAGVMAGGMAAGLMEKHLGEVSQPHDRLRCPVCLKASQPQAILGPRVVGTLAHEALGHLAEADLTLNSSFNGKLGRKVASETITMVDAPIKGTFGASKYDDEGVPMQRVDIIKDGIFQGLLTDREYAFRTELPASGSARAESFLVPPLIRMRNTFFEKGDYTNEELFEGIDFGYYCADYRGGEAQLDSSFQVGVQEAFEIHHGELGEPIKDLSISGIATEALFLIDGLGKEMGFEEGYCGKGQRAAVSSGGPNVRFKKGGILFGGRE